MIDMEDMKALLKEGNITDDKGQITATFIEKLQAIDKPVETANEETINAAWEQRFRDAFLNGTVPDGIETKKTNTEEKIYVQPAGGIIQDDLPDLDSFFKPMKE